MESARGHFVFVTFSSFSMCSPHHHGPDWVRPWAQFLPPGTVRDYLNPPLIRTDGLTPNANLSSECHPGQEFSSFSECAKRCPCGECPHEGSVYRPDLGILRHSSLPALLIQELAETSRLVRNLQSWCTRAATRFAQKFKVPTGLSRSSR